MIRLTSSQNFLFGEGLKSLIHISTGKYTVTGLQQKPSKVSHCNTEQLATSFPGIESPPGPFGPLLLGYKA